MDFWHQKFCFCVTIRSKSGTVSKRYSVRYKNSKETWCMETKAYQRVDIEISFITEDVVRTSPGNDYEEDIFDD